MKYNHEDYCTNIKNEEDQYVLTRPLFDVNMRLFKSSQEYKRIVLNVCEYLKWWVKTKKEGYKLPHGVSGANVGIPFNIICFNTNSGRWHSPMIMINPLITMKYGDIIYVESNCGSINLPKPIKVMRDKYIDVVYYDIFGNKHEEIKVDRTQGGLTIQHEVDHNLGILITDREIKGATITEDGKE